MSENSRMNMFPLISAVSLISHFLCLNCETLEIFDICTPEHDKCLKISSCPHILAAIKEGFKPKICSYINKEPIVCCTKDINRWKNDELTISGLMCDKYWIDVCPNSVPFVLGGDDARPKELPFMALIGYGSSNNILWKCGGSLISPKFVLSAAHCDRPGGERPTWVRLGELDYSTFLDDAKPQNYRIKNRIIHPGYIYPFGYNDIALFHLQKHVKFNDYIRPICLSQSPSLVGVGEFAIAAGWGAVDYGASSSKKLLKVNLQLFDAKSCYRNEYRDQIPDGIDEKSMLCAGSNEGGKDTCSGDSGGPLFQKPSADLLSRSCFLYTQIGITSFGYQCGLRDYPAIYTKVNHYLPWIEAIVWPKNVTDTSVIWQSNSADYTLTRAHPLGRGPTALR